MSRVSQQQILSAQAEGPSLARAAQLSKRKCQSWNHDEKLGSQNDRRFQFS